MTWEEVKKGNRDISLFFSSLLGEIDISVGSVFNFFFCLLLSVFHHLFLEGNLQNAYCKGQERKRKGEKERGQRVRDNATRKKTILKKLSTHRRENDV